MSRLSGISCCERIASSLRAFGMIWKRRQKCGQVARETGESRLPFGRNSFRSGQCMRPVDLGGWVATHVAKNCHCQLVRTARPSFIAAASNTKLLRPVHRPLGCALALRSKDLQGSRICQDNRSSTEGTCLLTTRCSFFHEHEDARLRPCVRRYVPPSRDRQCR